jgi:hypothetical protein
VILIVLASDYVHGGGSPLDDPVVVSAEARAHLCETLEQLLLRHIGVVAQLIHIIPIIIIRVLIQVGHIRKHIGCLTVRSPTTNQNLR